MSTRKRRAAVEQERRVARGLESDSEPDEDHGFGETDSEVESGSESDDIPSKEERETVDEKRVRLARQYLNALAKKDGESDDEATSSSADEDDDEETQMLKRKRRRMKEMEEAHGMVSNILEKRRREKEGRQIAGVAGRLKGASKFWSDVQNLQGITTLRGHKQSATCCALSDDERHAFSGGKDCTVIHWDIETGKQLWQFRGFRKTRGDKINSTADSRDTHPGHRGHVFCMAVNTDGNLLATGGADSVIKLWDVRANRLAHEFKGHKGAVTGLSFRRFSNDLYSCSTDRMVKVWNGDAQTYVETLYGHQGDIQAIDALRLERAITVSADRTLRVWKIVEESQLLFSGGHQSGSIDCVRWVTDDRVVTGGQDGQLASWSIGRRKPHCVLSAADAHGEGRWISALAVLPSTSIIASGSSSGEIHLWDVQQATLKHSFERVGSLPVEGHVNGLQFGRSGRVLVAAVGQENTRGRWERIAAARNGLRVFRLPLDLSNE